MVFMTPRAFSSAIMLYVSHDVSDPNLTLLCKNTANINIVVDQFQ